MESYQRLPTFQRNLLFWHILWRCKQQFPQPCWHLPTTLYDVNVFWDMTPCHWISSSRCHVTPNFNNLQQHCCENLKFQMVALHSILNATRTSILQSTLYYLHQHCVLLNNKCRSSKGKAVNAVCEVLVQQITVLIFFCWCIEQGCSILKAEPANPLLHEVKMFITIVEILL